MPKDIRQRDDLRTFRRRAYEELNLAVDQAGGELPSGWLRDGDHDLQALRDMEEPEWLLLVRRQTGVARPEDPQFPAAAWGDPHRRRNEWIGIGVVLAVLAALVVIASIPGEVWIVVGIVVAVVGLALTLALIFSLTRHRGWVLGGLVLVVAAIYGLTQAPREVPVTLALLAASAGALYMAARAAMAADAADKKSIALWDVRRGEQVPHARNGTVKPVEPEKTPSKPTDPDPPLLS
jgi:hypothetical protein